MTFTITYADPQDGRIVRADDLDAATLTHAAALAEMKCPRQWIVASVEREMRVAVGTVEVAA